jgi:hypothetical protein
MTARTYREGLSSVDRPPGRAARRPPTDLPGSRHLSRGLTRLGDPMIDGYA